MAMATGGGGGGGGGRRRLLIPQKKVWRQVIRKDTEVQHAMDDDIPNDILIEILLRLPAKSLVRLRWACKYLFDLVTRNPNFAKMHSTITTGSTNHDDDDDMFHNSSLSVLSTCYKGVDCNKVFQCYLNYNDSTRVANVSSSVSIAAPFNYYSPGSRPRIIDSCNGLILLYKELGNESNDWSIWNPCTKEYIILPPPLINTYACREEGNTNNVLVHYHTNYGFGYDHTNDDYKVIIYSYYKLVGSNYVTKLYSDVQVYTLGTNSWRRIESSPYGLCTNDFCLGVFRNGALYWVDLSEENIICFDIGTEKFRHVSEIPNRLTTGHRGFHCPRMYRLEGLVCCVVKFKNQQQKCSEMWVMKDYAVNNNESLWTELSTIPISRNRILLLKYTRNGEILMLMNKGDLILYDQKNNNPKILCKLSKKSTHIVNAVYTESLISLNSGTFTGQEQRKKTNNNNKKKKK